MRSWRWSPNPVWQMSLRKRVFQHRHTQRKEHMKTQKAMYKPRREASEEANAAGTLILDLKPPGVWDNKVLLLKLPSLWHFVAASVANQPRGEVTVKVCLQIRDYQGRHIRRRTVFQVDWIIREKIQSIRERSWDIPKSLSLSLCLGDTEWEQECLDESGALRQESDIKG